MGHKVHPTGFRLGIVRDWQARWYADAHYAEYLREDLTLRKVYQVLPDGPAEKKGLLRIIDESGEDYIYPVGFFFLIDVPQKVERALRQSVSVTA